METHDSELLEELAIRKSVAQAALPWALCLIFVAIAVLSLRHLSMTYDEDHFYAYGARILHLTSQRNNPTVMPVVALNALPSCIADFVGFTPVHNLLSRFPVARLPSILVVLGLGVLCYRWSYDLFGRVAGLVTLTLFAFEPNILAHSRLVTTDIYVTSAFTLAVYCMWIRYKRDNRKMMIWLGLALGLANVSKYSAVLLYPIVLVLLIIIEARLMVLNPEPRSFGRYLRSFLSVVGEFAVMVAISLVVINAAFLFRGTLAPLSSYEFNSSVLQSIQRSCVGGGQHASAFP